VTEWHGRPGASIALDVLAGCAWAGVNMSGRTVPRGPAWFDYFQSFFPN
jgi:hypothetical protein